MPTLHVAPVWGQDHTGAQRGSQKRVRVLCTSCEVPAQSICMAMCRGQREMLNPGEMNFPRFTAWLGNFSSSNKQKRIAGELTTKMQAAGVVCDRRDLRLQYLPTLRSTLTDPLVRHGADGIEAVLAIMQMYLISRYETLVHFQLSNRTSLDVSACSFSNIRVVSSWWWLA